MIDPAHVPPVESPEILARYILYSKHIRAGDRSIKPDAFIPHPYPDLSVTRHLQATEAEIWTVGQAIAVPQGKTLCGRGDMRAQVCALESLTVRADPVPGNPNHAVVIGWPADKAAQKSIAQRIAAQAEFKLYS